MDHFQPFLLSFRGQKSLKSVFFETPCMYIGYFFRPAECGLQEGDPEQVGPAQGRQDQHLCHQGQALQEKYELHRRLHGR